MKCQLSYLLLPLCPNFILKERLNRIFPRLCAHAHFSGITLIYISKQAYLCKKGFQKSWLHTNRSGCITVIDDNISNNRKSSSGYNCDWGILRDTPFKVRIHKLGKSQKEERDKCNERESLLHLYWHCPQSLAL